MTILPKSICTFNVIPIKSPMAFFTELKQNISQFTWKHKRPWIAKAVLRSRRKELEESSFLTSGYTTKLQSSRQYGTDTEQKYRPVEQDRTPRNKPMHVWVPYSRQRRQEYTMGQTASSVNVLGKLDSNM